MLLGFDRKVCVVDAESDLKFILLNSFQSRFNLSHFEQVLAYEKLAFSCYRVFPLIFSVLITFLTVIGLFTTFNLYLQPVLYKFYFSSHIFVFFTLLYKI